MLANELIDRLERLGLLDQEIVEALREQMQQGGTRVTPEAVAKLLVDNGQLTRYQATKLIGELRSGEYASDEEAAVEEVDDLTIVPEEGESEAELVAEVEPEEEVFDAEPVEAEAVEAIPVAEAVPEGVAIDGDEDTVTAPRPRPQLARVKRPETESTWDSFKIYGYLGLIVLLALSGFGLWWMLNKGSADDFIQQANKAYDQQQYQPAQEHYLAFLDRFGQDNQYSSLARTRITMAELYRAEEMTDPTAALDLAKEKLPTIENEEAMNDERGNLAALLVDIADNIAAAASEATDTEEKQRLLDRLDEQIELTENPVYMTSSMRTTLSGRLQAVAEARARVRRDIARNLRLDESVAGMQKALKAKTTKPAYEIRSELLRDFPELRRNEQLVSLIKSASDIQQTLVEPSANLPEIIKEPSQSDSIPSILLATRVGDSVPSLHGEMLYVRAGGSVLAFAGEDGRPMWRKFVGYGQQHLPVRLDGGKGVLLSDAGTLEVQRCAGEDGSLRWRSLIGESFNEPIVVHDTIYVSTESGRLLSLDAQSGNAKWAVQIPQELEVAPGIDERTDRAYIPGDHSNLYVLNTRDGSSIESYYIGHDKGTVAVPPVSLLGHLFVIENAGPDFAKVHVLRVDESGQKLRPAQPPFRLEGNVTVPPMVQGRRLIVLTDRGQVTVLDIEPTAEREQVSAIASLPPSYSSPTATQMAVGRGQMWITGTRIGRYDLQINTGRVVRDWVKHEGDTFIGRPIAFDNALVHARVLRGTSGIRVTAADPKSGQERWHTDVGVPVAMLTPIPDGKGFHAVTSQGALFELDAQSLSSGATQGPIENPGGKGVAMRFEDPLPIDETKRLLLNQAETGEMLVYAPEREREKLRKVTMQLPSGNPTGKAVIAGGGLFLPLDSGRAVVMNWQTGSMLGSPFQPASNPVGTVAWTTPIRLPSDSGQVVIADSRKSLYRLRVGDQIRELSSVALENELLGPAAGVGGTMVATTAGPAADFVVGYDLTTLKPKFQTLLDGRVTWGPVAAGDLALLQTNDEVLRAYDAAGEEQFQVKLPAGSIVGEPVLSNNNLVLAGKTGWLVSIDPNTGELVGQTDLGQPISASPLPVQDRLLVPGGEGVIYITTF